MLKHYIRTAFRNFRSNKIGFTGSLLTTCLAALCISLLFSFVHNELSMDNFHKRKNDIYTMIIKRFPNSEWQSISPSRIFHFDYRQFPELDNLTSVAKINEREATINYKETTYHPEGLIADSAFFKVFDFKLKVGDKKTVLTKPDVIILSEKFANKIFGKEDPIGKSLKLKFRGEYTHIVAAVIKVPQNSSITFDFIVPNINRIYSKIGPDFILVNNNFNEEQFKSKIEKLGQTHRQFKESQLSIIALGDIYFNKDLALRTSVISRVGDKKNVRVLIIVMLVILAISVLNFSNLQIINTNNNIKNNAINTINGAATKQLLIQKVTETFLLVAISTLVASVLYKISLPYFNHFTKVALSPPFWNVVLINAAILLLITFIASVYPLFVVLRSPVVGSLKSQPFKGNPLLARKSIVIFQYCLTIVLLTSSVFVVRQLNMMLTKDLGFKSKNIIKTQLYFSSTPGPDFYNNWDKLSEQEKTNKIKEFHRNFYFIQNELAAQSTISAFSQADSPLHPIPVDIKLKGSIDEKTTEKMVRLSTTYKDLFGLQIIEGRFFQRGRDVPGAKKVVINEAAKKFWNIDDILENHLIGGTFNEEYEIIGVVKDFNYERLSVRPKPLIMVNSPKNWDDDFFIRFQDGLTQEGIKAVETIFKKYNPSETFEYSFLSDEIEAMYQKEKHLRSIYIIFTFIALLISAIGLFTIALYDARKRIKEIGIRKVNGAKVSEILAMLTRDFVKWVATSFIIACPIAYFAMHKWLENFAYKTSLSWWIFALAGLLALGIALLTISFQSWKAATRNPVEALRYE